MNRLDIEITKRQIIPSRARAKEAILKGEILVNGKQIIKPSLVIKETDEIDFIGENLKYVSRGGLKLEKALKKFNIDLNDKIMIDIGSSTGGFSDCALQHGIKKIYAIDVGSNQLVEKLKFNTKILSYENTDFRKIDKFLIRDANIITIDVSFISVTKLLDKISSLETVNEIICLIKPQFECGWKIATKYKGIIKNKEVHENVIKTLIDEFKKINFNINNLTYSPIKGGSGNIEYLGYFTKKEKKEININEIVNEAFTK